jgi:hypothetical protein
MYTTDHYSTLLLAHTKHVDHINSSTYEGPRRSNPKPYVVLLHSRAVLQRRKHYVVTIIIFGIHKLSCLIYYIKVMKINTLRQHIIL